MGSEIVGGREVGSAVFVERSFEAGAPLSPASAAVGAAVGAVAVDRAMPESESINGPTDPGFEVAFGPSPRTGPSSRLSPPVPLTLSAGSALTSGRACTGAGAGAGSAGGGRDRLIEETPDRTLSSSSSWRSVACPRSPSTKGACPGCTVDVGPWTSTCAEAIIRVGRQRALSGRRQAISACEQPPTPADRDLSRPVPRALPAA